MKLNVPNIFEIYNKTLKENLTNESLILEDIEGKNINRAEQFIKRNYPQYLTNKITLPNGETMDMSRARNWIHQIRLDVPSVRLPIIKNGEQSHNFILGVTRLYFSFTEGNPDEIQGKISQLENIMSLIVNKYVDRFDKNLSDISDPKNPKELSYEDLDKLFANEIKQNIIDRNNKIDELASQGKLIKDDSYTIVRIPNFVTAQKYSRFTKWCVTKQKTMYNIYTKNGLGVFYFCLKEGYEKLKKPTIKPTQTNQLDEYGKSMIAISINIDGSLNSCTSRWNMGDSVLENELEISKFFGVVFKDTFKPIPFDEVLNSIKKDAIPSEIAKKQNSIETEEKLFFVKNEKIIEYTKCYDKDNIKCFAYDKLYWFDTISGEEIDPPDKINGDFICIDINPLISLEGAPKIVTGIFNCSHNKSLKSLKGAPREVGEKFHCSFCDSLTSLEGAPKKTSYFNCSNCPSLTSLEGAPEEVSENFYCIQCSLLKSLNGAPEKIYGDFFCTQCISLTSLEGGPRIVGKSFICSHCTSLTSLEGAPKEVGGSFNCGDCTSLTSLEGAPEEVGRDFTCSQNSSLSSLYGAPRKIRGRISFTRNNNLLQTDVLEYRRWLKTNPTENYLVNTSIDESYVKYIASNFTRLF